MLDDDDRVAAVDKLVEHSSQRHYVGRMQSRGRFLEKVHRVAPRWAGKLCRELCPLCFAAGKGRAWLAQGDVAQPDFGKYLKRATDFWYCAEKLQRLVDRHVEHVCDVLPLIGYCQGIGVIPSALAPVARDPDLGKKAHLKLQFALAPAFLASSSFDVERESVRPVVHCTRFRS